MAFRSEKKCLDINISKSRLIGGEEVVVSISIRNNNFQKIEDVRVISILAEGFTYKNNSFCIDDISFNDKLGIEEIKIDTLYREEEIDLSYTLISNRGFNSSEFCIDLRYKLYNEEFFERVRFEIDEVIKNENYNNIISLEKKVKEKTAIIGEEICYEIILKNNSYDDVINIDIVDILGSELEISSEYIKVAGRIVDIEELAKGIHLDKLEAKEEKVVEYKARVLSVGKNKKISNKVYYSYEVNTGDEIEFISSNILSEEIKIYNVNLEVEKIASKKVIKLNDEVEFLIKVKNKSDINLYHVNIYEFLYENLEFKQGSLYKGTQNLSVISLDRGINIGSLECEEELILSYKATVKTISGTGFLYSSIGAECKYKCDLKSPLKVKIFKEKKCEIEAKNPTLTYTQISSEIDMLKDDVEIIDILEEIDIKEFYIVKTAKCRGLDNTNLTGFRLNIIGRINRSIEYMFKDIIDEIYVMEKSESFCRYITVGEDYKVGSSINVRGSSKMLTSSILDKKLYIKSLVYLEAFIKSF